MAKRDSTISLSFKMDDKGSIDSITKNTDGLKRAMTESLEVAEKLNNRLVNWGMAAQAAHALGDVISQMQGAMSKLTSLYDAQASAEAQLTRVMRNTMGASDDEIESIKALASAQQALGVIGDEVTLAGAQKLAGFAREKASLDALVPVMNDMVAQQYGFNASQENAAAVATMLGKALNGQYSILQRNGYTFTEAQQAIIKYGTEAERVAVIAEVVSARVGGVNAAMAQTDAGRAVQAANAVSDLGEEAGRVLTPVKAMMSGLALIGQSAAGVMTMVSSLKALGAATKGIISLNAIRAAGEKTLTAVTAAYKAVQVGLNAVLAANPLGAIVAVIFAVVSALTVLYNESETFRSWVDNAVTWIKSFSKVIWDYLVKAWDAVSGAIKRCWGFIKTILGISSDVQDTYDTETSTLTDLTDAYETNTKAIGKNAQAKKAAATAGSLAAVKAQVSELQTALDNAAPSERPAIAARLALAENAAAELQSVIDHEKFAATVDFRPAGIESGAGLGPLMPTAQKASSVKVPEVKSWSDAYRDAINVATASNFGFIKSSESISSTFQSLGKVVKGAAADWLNWGASVMQAIATAIPQIVALTAMQKGQATANAEAGVTGAVAATASIPVVGPALAVAAVASILAAMASIPKFASGGIAYGPTLGMFGEYAGASRNPEVVAPLDRLRSLISPAGGQSGKVEFEIDGRVLRGVLRKVDSVYSRG